MKIKVSKKIELKPFQNVVMSSTRKTRRKGNIKLWAGEVTFHHEREFPLTLVQWNTLRKELMKAKTDVFVTKPLPYVNRHVFYTVRGFGDKYYLTEISHDLLKFQTLFGI